jgi:hypothetical protein
MTRFREEIRVWRDEQEDKSIPPLERTQSLNQVATAVAEAGREKAAQEAAGALDQEKGHDSLDSLGEEEVDPAILLYRKETQLGDKERECRRLKEGLLEVQKGILGKPPGGGERGARQREADQLEARIDACNIEIAALTKEYEELQH